MRLACFAAIVTSLLAVASASAADLCKGGPQNQWKSAKQAAEAAIDNGFAEVVQVNIRDGCYEVVVLDGDGRTVWVLIDPVTLDSEKVEDPR